MLRALIAIASCAAIQSEFDDGCSTPEVSLLQVNLELGHSKLESTAPRERPGPPHRQELRNSGDTHYLGEIKVGNQSIWGILDTGSFELVVTSKRCEFCFTMTSVYDPDASDTYKSGLSGLHHSDYGSGSTIDMLAYDNVELGDGNYVAKDQPFWMVVGHLMPIMLGADFAAIIGLGKNGAAQLINNDTQPGLPEALTPYTRKFSHCLEREPGAPGWMIWSDETPENAIPLEGKGELFWAVQMNETELSSGLDLGCSNGCGVILDSGTSLMTAPSSIVDQINEELDKIDADCENLDSLPDMVFKLDGKDFRLPPESYIGYTYGELDLSISSLLTPPVKKCRALIMKFDMESQFGPGWILGMPFFREFYTTFSSRDGVDMIYTTPAGDGCYPSSGTALTEMDSTSSTAKKALPKAGAVSVKQLRQLRRLAANTIRAPPWLIRAAAKGEKKQIRF